MYKNKQFNSNINSLWLVFLAACLLWPGSASCQSVKVAVSANLQSVVKVLQNDFKQKTGLDMEPIIGSSGNLTTQIRNGAPFDLFLSADMAFPETLFKEGFSVKKPVVYAQGRLIICSNTDMDLKHWEQLLQTEKIKKIAIANPAIAPYGKAAEEALQQHGILSRVKAKIVYGESISQVNTYITTGTVEAGFTTQSLVKDASNKTPLYWHAIDPKSYAPVQQGMVLIKRADTNKDALKFYEYILSKSAKAIFKEYGYLVP